MLSRCGIQLSGDSESGLLPPNLSQVGQPGYTVSCTCCGARDDRLETGVNDIDAPYPALE
ncbi:hypothetical protein GCM10023319_74280 [Nocardia iowensis]